MADYNALFQAPNAGAAFAQSFEAAQEKQKQMLGQRALSALAQDPSNPRAMEVLAKVNPQAAIEFREKAQAQQLKTLEAHRGNIKIGAQILKSVNPTDDASYQQARQLYIQSGGDPTDVPANYDPQYVRNVIALDAQLNPDHDNTAGDIREFQQAQTAGYLPQGTTFQQFLQMKNPGMVSPVTIPANATVTMPGQGGGNVPRVTDQSSYDAIPPGGQYMDPEGHIRTKGGQAGQPSPAGFSGSSRPR